jgi:hypothetical protein
MPNDPVIVYLKETGEPTAMHSVDAAEALRLGDYVATAPEGKEPNTAQALTRMRSPGPSIHPELQTPEEREEARRQAYEVAVATAQVTGQPLPPNPPGVVGTASRAASPVSQSRPLTPPRTPPAAPAEDKK